MCLPPYLKKKASEKAAIISVIMSKDTTKQDVYSVNKSVMEIQKHLECSIWLV